MKTHSFTLILANLDVMSEELASKLYAPGCNDGTLYCEGTAAIAFDREADSLDEAIATAIADVNKAGLNVARRMEIDRNSTVRIRLARKDVSRKMKFITLIPLFFNNGQPIPEERINGIIDDLVNEFGGCSEEGVTKGKWIDPMDAKFYRDENLRISVACDKSLLWDARQAVIRIGQQLGQRAMYFAVRDYDGVQILEIPPGALGNDRNGS